MTNGNFCLNSEGGINDSSEYHLRVYKNRSELVLADGSVTKFKEGPNNEATKIRYKNIINALKSGYLRESIRLCRENYNQWKLSDINEKYKEHLDHLVDAVTSEIGRGLIALTVLQVTVKCIEPAQSIRLHKGGRAGNGFGWEEGISMRTLDKDYITPVLREEGLLRLNADGFMMTRTLAENYPYTGVYKAAIRGAREDWFALVEGLEKNEVNPLACLHYLLSRLLIKVVQFEELTEKAFAQLKLFILSNKFQSTSIVINLIKRHMEKSDYAARIMEIAMHALMQSLQEVGALVDSKVVPLSQMRSANKKHGNIGDIELVSDDKIIESWDAKYGKSYFRDELEELSEKISGHDGIVKAGFVSSVLPIVNDEVKNRIIEIESLLGIKIYIVSLDEWVKIQLDRTAGLASEEDVAKKWMTAYIETLALKRLKQAPIDEPSYQWLQSLIEVLSLDI